MVSLFSSHKSKLGLILCFFLVICANYASQIHLWGDETMAILRANNDWREILTDADNHTPTYFLLLKLLTPLISSNSIFALRLLHVVPFLGGLYLGYLTLKQLFPHSPIPLLTLAIAIFLPNYIFYATNIRMYSLTFLAAMAFIYIIILLLLEKVQTSFVYLFALFLISLALTLSNFTSLIYLFPGLFICLYKRHYRPFLAIFIAFCIGFAAVVIVCPGDIKAILNWQVVLSQGISTDKFSLISFAKQVYFGIRPGLDLIYPAGFPVVIALGLPILLIILYFIQLGRLGWQNKSNLALQFILINSCIWLLVAPTGYAFTRFFLPSQFFMVAILVKGIYSSKKLWMVIFSLVVIGMVIINIKEVVQPTLRLYSMIPYEEIASDVIKQSQVNDVKTIILSNNSLNTKSIEYFLNKKLESTSINLTILFWNPKLDMPAIPLIFVSHLEENEEFTSRKTLAKKWNLTPEKLQGYIKIERLPYNFLWRQRISDRASQPEALITYILR